MIISHRHKYIFVEIPLTGSWAIRNALLEHYDGEVILEKHSSIVDLSRNYPEIARDYYSFATVRNPLDEAVSRYFKYKTNHKGAFTSQGAISSLKSDDFDREKFEFVSKQGATFPEYFKRFHGRPYSGAIDSSGTQLDFVMRFERLQQDFATVLKNLGLDLVGPVPIQNKTRGRRANWSDYYTWDIIEQAKYYFSPFMHKWGYDFPEQWGEIKPRRLGKAKYYIWSICRRFYLEYIRYNRSVVGRIGRKIRATFDIR